MYYIMLSLEDIRTQIQFNENGYFSIADLFNIFMGTVVDFDEGHLLGIQILLYSMEVLSGEIPNHRLASPK